MFKRKCPHCGAKNDNERITCMECGKPFDLKKTEEEFTVAPAEQLEQEKEEEEEMETVPDTFQNETQSAVDTETTKSIENEDSLIEDEADILDGKIKDY